MRSRFLNTVTFVVIAACSTLALAQTPARVGRISLSQGQVGIAGELGEETNAAVVNWPVTSRNQLTTGRDSRTEIRIGSTALRLDADSALDVTELDDETLRLHLHYGSISVRVRNPEVLRGFELSTPQGMVRMQEAGRLRVDAGRRQDTTMVSVFDGVAVLDGGGSRLTLRAGKRAEVGQDDVRTSLATRDSFDNWAMLRDERDDRSESIRYVSSEMTGYEDLDQNGSWQDNTEYGPLWSPRRIPLGWAPYRDGQWTYLQPWGWTWVDNAPWGYAPFHYGRWVMVNQRWSWAPGRNMTRAIWSPALVGWVGGSGWNLSFNQRGTHRAAPAQGWYPLAPRDAYVPTYRMNHDNLRFVNRHAGEARDDARGRKDGRRDGHHRAGLTIVPHDQFSQRGTVSVRGAPQPVVSATALGAAPVASAPTAPVTARVRGDLRDPRRAERERDGDTRLERGPASDLRRESRFGNDDPRPQRAPRTITLTGPAPAAAPAAPAPVPTPVPAPQPVVAAPAAPAPAPAVVAQPRDDRWRGDRERIARDPDLERDRRPRGAEAFGQRDVTPRFQQQVRQIPQPMQNQPQAAPQVQQQPRVERMAPPPQQPVQVERAQPSPIVTPPPPPARREGREEGRRRRDEAGEMQR